MSTSLKVFFTIFTVFIVGLSAYLGYVYFFRSPNLNPSLSQPAAGSESQGTDYQGQILCIHDTKKGTSLSACDSFGMMMSDDTYYELILGNGVRATGYTQMEKVKVSGVLTPGTSPLGLDGTLTVSKISK